MNGWKVRKSLLPWIDKVVELGILGADRDEVVNTMLCMEIVHLSEQHVFDVKVKEPRRWFPRLRKKQT